MTLIKSISGIRGTIGGSPGTNLTPPDIIKFAAAFAIWLKNQSGKKRPKLVIGRDARISGEMLSGLVVNTLVASGIDVVDLGLATTPTVEIAVPAESADGGIILTASHNPGQWNALKLVNSKGEFISAADGADLLSISESNDFDFARVENLGQISRTNQYKQEHIRQILELEYVNTAAIREAGFRVAIDCVNSVGGLIIPDLLKQLGVNEVIELYCEPTGIFPHNPEPLREHLEDISQLVKKERADLAFVVDPDVDRLAIISEDGEMFGEEYTLVAVADFILKKKAGGNTVSNLSSTRALRDITEKYGGEYSASAVGEVNVVNKMKSNQAVIGGEGNGGVIYPDAHYGRDALVGIALFLSHMAESGLSCSQMRASYPDYYISKNKMKLDDVADMNELLERVGDAYKEHQVNKVDGIRIDFEKEWVHLRKSNTEAIIRVIAESTSPEAAEKLARAVITRISEL